MSTEPFATQTGTVFGLLSWVCRPREAAHDQGQDEECDGDDMNDEYESTKAEATVEQQ